MPVQGVRNACAGVHNACLGILSGLASSLIQCDGSLCVLKDSPD